MKVLHKAKQLLQGFVLSELSFRPSGFLPRQSLALFSGMTRRKKATVLTGFGSFALVGSFVAGSLLAAGTTQLGVDSTIDYTANLSATSNTTILSPTSLDSRLAPTGTNSFSVQMWVNPGSATVNASERLLVNMEHKYAILVASGRWQYWVGNGTSWSTLQDTGVTVSPSRWSHLSLVLTSNNSYFYIDGQLVHTRGSRQDSGGSIAGKYFAIGAWAAGEGTASRLFDGQVDEVKLWQSDRSSTVASDMHSRHTTGAKPDIYWDFNEGSGTTVHDRINSVHLTASTIAFSDVKTVRSASGGDTVLTFPRTYLAAGGGWTPPSSATNFRVLAVAGGGGGGASGDNAAAGGGGAGGFREEAITVQTGSATKVQVGLGGRGNKGPGWDSGNSGQNSEFSSLSVVGGGGGGGRLSDGLPGGSGGGAGGRKPSSSVNGLGGSAVVAGQGNKGGDRTGSEIWAHGGGGGGAGGAGGNGTDSSVGSGGLGRAATIVSGTYSAGGGGGSYSSSSNGANATSNTGNGGGGAGGSGSLRTGGDGGSGVVIVRYTPTIDLAVDLSGNVNSLLTGPTGVIPSGAFTFESWVYLRSNVSQTIFSEGTGHPNSTVYLATLASGQFYVRWGTVESNTGVGLAPVDRWAHVALVRGASGLPSLYVDGALIWSSTNGDTSAPNNAGPFRIGIQVGDVSSLNGQIDQVKVWNVALTPSELALSMQNYGATQSNGSAITSQSNATLSAHYDFNEFSGERLELDRSGNGRNLTYGSALSSSSYNSNQILETGTAHSLQTYVKFNRSYLTATGGWTPPNGVTSFKALVAGGGGAGGSRHAGGGGAGALLWSDNTSISGVTRIQVGQGALGITNITNHNGNLGGQSGQSSFLGTSELKGGGGGAGAQDTAKAGGSSGGLAGTGTAVAGGSGLGLKNAGGVGANGTHNGATQYTGGGGGGALSAGITSTASAGGQGGAGYVSNITGQAACYAAGGGGGATSGATGAAGGACTSGQVSATVPTSAGGGTNASYTGTIAGSGSVNSGSGGGAGGFNSTSGRSGGGGSGVVILSYGANLEVTRTATAARAGSNFSQAIQVTAGNGASEHDITITATGQVLRVGSGGSAATAVTVRTVGGVATFTDLGFTSNVGVGARTLTFSSDAFVGTTLTIIPSQTASTVNITSSGTTNGVFVNGNFESSTTGTANILNTDLQTHMQSFSTTVESAGTVTVSNSVTSPNSSKSLTLASTGGNVTVNAAISGLSSFQVGCDSGSFSSNSSGTIAAGANISIQCSSISTGAAITSGGSTSLSATGATSDLTAGANITISGVGEEIVLKSKRSVLTSANVNLRTIGGPLTIWSDTDATSGGGIRLGDSNSICSGWSSNTCNSTGGNITLGGGAANVLDSTIPGGAAKGFGSTDDVAGITLGPCQAAAGVAGASIASNGGSISINGEGSDTNASTSYISAGLALCNGASINSGSGKQTLKGVAKATSGYNDGFWVSPWVANGSATVTSTNSSDDAVTLYAEGPRDGFVSFGLIYQNSNGGGLLVQADSLMTGVSKLDFRSAGAMSIQPTGTSFRKEVSVSADFTLSTSTKRFEVGSTTNTQTISVPSSAAKTIAGDMIFRTSSFTSASALTTTGANSQILVVSDDVALGANLATTSSSGLVTLAPRTNSRVIDLGTEVSGRLSLTSTELNRVSAGTLRIGALNGTNSGNINVTAAIAPTGVSTLALRTTGTVESSGSGSITEVNLAISAAYINLGGNNSITGNLALSSANATLSYNQISGSFTPATVDQIAPEYGVATQIIMSQVPVGTPVDEMMAVAFNPPPVATLKDKFDNELTTANAQSTSYTVTATKASGPGNLTGTASTTTSTRGVARFTNLGISDSYGVHRITFTATVTATSAQISGTPSSTTGDYNIKVDQTVSFTSSAPTLARASGTTYRPEATATSSLSVSITVDAASSSVCSISGGIVSFLTAGTCVLNANQAGNSAFTAAPQVQQSFAVASAQLDTPTAPTVAATANTLKSLDVSWTAVANAASYTVKVYAAATGSESAQVVEITGTSTTIRASEFPTIADSTMYYVSVTAITTPSERNSAESLKSTGTTNSPAATPTIAFQPTGVNKTVGQSATFSVGATKSDNGVLSYQWQKNGSNISGAISSTLTRDPAAESDSGSYSVVVTNSLNGTTASTTSNAVSFTVSPTLTITTPTTGLSATVNSAYSLSVTATGGRASLSFSTSSTLPTGITLSSAGVLSGTPTQAGTFPLTVTVTDLNSATATTSSFNLLVASAPGLVPTFATPVSAISGSTDRLSVQITNFDSNYTYTGTSSIGSVSVDSSGLVVFSGVSSGQTAVATITTSRSHYLEASASVSATLNPIPVISYNASDLNSFGTTTSVRDLSGRNNHATRSATVQNSFDIDAASGAWKFPGGTNAAGPFVDLPDLATNTFSSGTTIDFEANFGSANNWERIIDFGKGVGSNLGPGVDNLFIGREGTTSNLVVDVLRGGSATRCQATGALSPAAFHRWTVILGSSSCVIMRDGVTLVSNNSNMSVSSNQTWSSNFIGRSNWVADDQFEGQIRYLRMYAGTPSFSQIGAVSYKTVSYNANGGSTIPANARGTTSGELLLSDAITRTGYGFLGWYDSTNTLTRTKIGDAGARYTPSSDIALFAGWDANELAVTFNSNSGTLVTSTTTRTGEQLVEPTPPTRTGYTFAGWFPDNSLTGTAITFPYAHVETANFTLYAKWTANPFTVTFDSNSGTAVTAFTTRTAEALPNSFTTSRAGYNFDGWFTDSGFTGSAISFPYTHGQTANFTLYAKWSAKTLTVSFNVNGGSAVTSATTRTAEAFSTTATSTRDGYTFEGWFASSTLTGSRITFPHTHGQTDNFTLYAKWEANTLAVTFEPNGGTAVSATSTRTAEQFSTTATSTRTGYTFAGWFDNVGLTGSALSFPHTHGRTSDIFLYAKWTPNINTVTFDANYSGGSTRTQSITSGVSTALTANVFTRTGYTFDGWSTNDDGTGTTYTNLEVVGVTSSFTLYAKWSANTLNVTFNTNSGSAITTATTRTGLQFTSTATTIRAGYTFAGWFDNAEFTGTEVTFPYTHLKTANFTLYAKWTANDLTVTFNTNSGSAVTAVTTRTAESMPTTLTTTRAGYTFLGWFAAADFSGTAISFPYTHGKTADFTLYAKWDANTLNVSFATNSGSSVTATTTRTGVQIASSFTTTREGYNFLGWFDNAEFTGSAISFPYTHGKTADFTLYAKWDANTLTVSYNSNSGSSVTATSTRTAESMSTGPINPTRAGYSFLGWFAAADLSGTAISFPYAHGKTTNFTLYAKWDANTLNVSFESNSGSAVTATTTRTGEQITTAPVSPTRTGYTFDGWYEAADLTGSQVGFPYAHTKTADFTLYAKWNANVLNVSFNSNSGSAMTAVTTRTGEAITSAPVAPTRAGYDFVAWYENSDLSGTAIAFPYTHGKTESFTLNAKWEAKALTVSFNTGGGSAVSSMTTRTAESMASAPTNPTRAGYNFLGWVESEDLTGSVVLFPYIHGKTGDFILYAKWDANTLSVTFDTNGGVAVTATTVRTDGQITSTITTTRAGYAFVGWFDNAELTGSVVTFPYTHGKTANFTLFAKWNANTLNVTFDTNSGTAVTATTTRTGVQLSASVTTTRAGYTFAGWFDNVGLTGSQVSFPFTHGQTTNFTLYAKWTPNTLNVRFELNDGTGGFSTATTTTGSEVAAPATNPTHPGFEFLGWSATEGGSALSFPHLHGRTTDFTLHAVWKAGNYTVLYQYNGATGGNSVTSQGYTTDIARTGIVLPVPTRTAYSFTGWRSDISLATPLELKPNGRFVPIVNQTVYAEWTPIDYTVTYNAGLSADSGTVPVDSRLYNIGQTVSLLSNSGLLGRTGYNFAGWLTSPSSSDAGLNSGQTVTVGSTNINFYPKWTAKTYSISYNLNGGSGSLTGAPVSWTVGTSNVTLPSSGFTRTGYDFGGWARTAGGSAVSNSFSNNFVDENLTAIWTLKTIGYTFAPGAASSSGITRWPANASGNFGSEITLPDLDGEIVTISGSQYLFFGWGDGSATFRSGQKFVLTETLPQFTAQWVKLLDVRYSFGGGTKSVSDTETNDGDLECVNAGLCAPNQEITLRGAPTRLGYTFAGWKTQDASETVLREAGTKTVIRDDNYLFFAEWTPIDYNFSFNSLGGSINNANLTGNIGRVLTMPSAGTRTGYTFSGWSSDGGVTKFAAGPTFVIGSISVGFEATWVPDVYQISFDWQGGVGSPEANSSFTVGRGPMTLPGQGDRVKDGYNFAGWSTTPGGDVVSNYEPTANGVLYAKWDDGNYTVSFNAQNGPTPVTDVLVQRTTSTILRTPTRPNFRLIGWFDAVTGGNFVGNAGEAYLPTASKTLYARWVQSSFFGVDEAALETATTYTASSGSGIDTTITHNPSGSRARIQIPAGTLPNETVVSVRYFKDVTRQRSVIGETNNYFFSVLVSWLLGTGATATVPDTLPDGFGGQKPITVTLSNTQIKAGAMVYQVIDGVVTPLQRATVDGSITVLIYSDPELVVAATPPTAPQNVLVVGPGRGSSTVSWLAPTSTGGSPITGYDVFLDNVLACSTVTALTCDLTNLSDSNTYNVKVKAKNAVGNGTEATTSFTTEAPPSSGSGSGGGSAPGPVPPAKPVDPPKPVAPVKPVAPAPVAPAPAPVAPVAPAAPVAPSTPSDPGAAPSDPGTDPGIGAAGDDAPPVPFDPLSSPEGVEALTDSLGNAAAAVGAIAAAAAAAAAAAGAAGAAGGSSGGSGSSSGSGEGGSIATINAQHDRYINRRRGRGDKWKMWKSKWLTFADKPAIWVVVKSSWISPLFSKIAVDGAYLRAAFGSLGLLPTIAAAAISVMSVSMNDGAVLTPQWQWFIVLAVIGIFDAFAGLVGTLIFVAGTVATAGTLGIDDVRLLLGVIIVGYGPALLANAFRAFRKEPEEGEEYWYERLVDLVVLPFIGGWVTATMISILPALAGTTMAVANHVNEFAIAIAIAITLRVVFEEIVGRWFPARLDTLHPTDVDDPASYQKWISVAFRLAVFVFVTAALMGNVWQVWVGSALFILPTIIGFYAGNFKNYPWIWRVLPTGIPGLAFALIVASVTTSIVNSWFGSTPDLALWSFALLPIPMLGIAILAMIGREGNEGEVRWIRRPGFKWVYRIGGVFMLLATMELAGVLDIFPF